MRKQKAKWDVRSVGALMILITLALITLGSGVFHYQPALKAQAQQQLLIEEQMLKEIEEAFTSQTKLQMTQMELDTLKQKHTAIINSKKARTILDTNRLKHPRYIIEVMFRLWEQHGGIADYVPYCIAAYESEYNTFTHNTNGEDSRGLFQVNVPYHRGANPTKLFEPAYNMDYIFDELVRYEKQGIAKGLTGIDLVLYVARYGQRPNWEKCSGYITTRVTRAYNEYMDLKLN